MKGISLCSKVREEIIDCSQCLRNPKNNSVNENWQSWIAPVINLKKVYPFPFHEFDCNSKLIWNHEEGRE